MRQFQFSISEKECALVRSRVPYWLPVGEAAKQLLLNWSKTRESKCFNPERFRQVALKRVCRPQEKAVVLALSLMADNRGRISACSVRLAEMFGWGRRNSQKMITCLCVAGVCSREDGQVVLVSEVSK